MRFRPTLRQLNLLLLAYIGVLSLLAAVWVVYSGLRDWHRTEWMTHVDELTDLLLETGTAAAMERGLGTIALARDGPSPTLYDRALVYRSQAESLHAQSMDKARRLPEVWARLPPPRGRTALVERIKVVERHHSTLQKMRLRLDRTLSGVGGTDDAITPESWFNTVSDYNDSLRHLLHVASATPGWVPMPFSGCVSVKGNLFTLVEYAARERAIVAGVITARRALNDQERDHLLSHRAVLENTLENVKGTVAWLPASNGVDASLTEIRQTFFERYTPLFEEVLQAVGDDGAAPAGGTWFREATAGVDSLHALRDAMSAIIDQAVDAARSDTLTTASLRGALLVGLLTAPLVAIATVRRRVLTRLEVLLQAAKRLRRGELSSPIVFDGDDELGELATTLEAMRSHLERELRDLRATRQELLGKAAHLDRVNRELEQFAYVAAHDLKSPLRAVHSLSSWIEEDVGDRLSDEGRRQLALLRQRVRRMDHLIDGLLKYSRAGGRGTSELVDTAALVGEILASDPPPPRFRVHIAEGLPRLVADRVQLEQVFGNLIRNVIEHHHRPGSGQLWITAERRDDEYLFTVADDGPGIAPAQHMKVFELFRRLETTGNGTGIGLAVVKKLVERAGGHVSVESDGHHGTAFHFTWPA